MTNLEIEAFLAIYRTKKISAAAEDLYISQSSLSARLQTLEKELDCTLFIRGKGSRTLEPTEAGERFHHLAQSYMDIVRQMKELKGKRYEKRLRVTSINSIGTYLLMPVYERFMKNYPEVFLRVSEYNNDRSKPVIQKGQTDLLFSPNRFISDEIESFPIFTEPILLICSADSDYPETITINDLPEEKEIYINWDDGYDAWHRTYFRNTYPRLDVDNMEQLRYFLRQKDRWAFVSGSGARTFLKDPMIRQLKLETMIPSRIIYCACSRAKRHSPEIEAFLSCLQEELRTVTF